MMSLNPAEKTWLSAYRDALTNACRGQVLRLALFGSKARGDDHPGSDLDVLLIVKDALGARKRELRRIGYRLSATGEVVPSILVYTESEWSNRKRSRSPFRRAVERDQVRL